MAIVIALTFAFCLLILILGMWISQRNTAGQTRLLLQNQQAFFAARAAMQHFLVKARVLPTELYDAVAFTQGKNPMCSFAEYSKTDTIDFEPATDKSGPISGPNGETIYCQKKISGGDLAEPDRTNKPKYVYLQLDPPQNGVFFRLGSFYNPAFRFLNRDLVDPTLGKKQFLQANQTVLNNIPNRKVYLEYYLRDCTNATSPVKLQPMLVFEKKPGVKAKDWKLSDYFGTFDPDNPAQFPYSMVYKVNKIEIAAMKELRKYGEEAIQVEVEGTIVDFQGKVFSTKQVRTQKITRTGTL